VAHRLPSGLALGVLAAVAVAAPWPFGAVQPAALLGLTATCLLAAACALALGGWRGELDGPGLPLWPLVGLLSLGLAQLVPLPPALHSLVAPGSSAVWHPASEAAAAVLGGGPRPVSLDPDTTLRSVAILAGLGLLGWLAAPAFARRGAAVAAAAAVAVGGFGLAAYAIFARARFGKLLYGHFTVPTINPFGPFVSKNHFAGYVVMASLLCAGLAVGLVDRERGRGRDWTAGPRAGAVVGATVAAIAMALAVLASLSRGGGLALVAGGLALLGLLVARDRGTRTQAGFLSAIVAATALGALLLTLAPPETHERMRSVGGTSFRLDTWRGAVLMAASSPVVGHGLGSFHDAYPRFKAAHGRIRVEHAENDYLEVLAEGGLVGTGLVIAGAGLLLLGGRNATAADRTVRGIGLGATAGLVALAVHSAVDFNLRIPSNAALAALLAAAAAGAAGTRPRSLSRASALLLAAGAVSLLVAVMVVPGRPATRARQEAALVAEATTAPAQALRLERAEAMLVAVVRRRPAHAESWLMLAGVRAARGERASAAELARHAVSLDPRRAELLEAAERLMR